MPAIETVIQDFIAAFETKDAQILGLFLDEKVRFETLNQASNGSLVLAEQIHHLGLAGREPAPIRNMAVYEVQDGLIAVWRDYKDSKHARRLLDESKPLPG